jgi:hypothetical protein
MEKSSAGWKPADILSNFILIYKISLSSGFEVELRTLIEIQDKKFKKCVPGLSNSFTFKHTTIW